MPRIADSGISLRALDANGAAVSGAHLQVYRSKTTDPVTVFADADYSALHSGEANAAGVFGPAYLKPGAYKIDIRHPDTGQSLPGYPVDDVAMGTAEGYSEVSDMRSSSAPPAGEGAIWSAGGFSYREAAPGATDADIETRGGVKLYARPLPAEYVDRQFDPAVDGVTDDAAVFQKIAANIPSGKTLRIAGGGERILGSPVHFPQDNLTIRMDRGAVLKQGPGTLTMDTMIEISGDGAVISGGEINGNLAGNTGNYTGRAELLRVSGDGVEIDGLTIRGTRYKAFATGLYLTGRRATIRNLYTYQTGLNAVRDWCDFSTYDGVWMYDIYGAHAHGLSKDAGYQGGIFKKVVYKNIHAFSDGNEHYEAILVDDDRDQGGHVVVKDVFIDFPNATGPDSIKFAYCDQVDIDGLTVNHGGNGGDNSSLRFQNGPGEFNIRNVDLAGGINMDTVGSDKTLIRLGGKIVTGRVYPVPAAIQQINGGKVLVERGADFRNIQTAAFTVNPNPTGRDTIFDIGPCSYSAAPDVPPPPVIKGMSVPRAGQIRISDPIEATGMRSRSAHGSWITVSLNADAPCCQGLAASEFMVSNGGGSYNYMTEFGPPNVRGWTLGDRIRALNATTSDATVERICTRPGMSCTTPYANSVPLSVGAHVFSDGRVFKVTTAGTTAADGVGPTHDSGAAMDGTVEFTFVDQHALFGLASAAAA